MENQVESVEGTSMFVFEAWNMENHMERKWSTKCKLG